MHIGLLSSLMYRIGGLEHTLHARGTKIVMQDYARELWADFLPLLHQQAITMLNPQSHIYPLFQDAPQDLCKVLQAAHIQVVNLAHPQLVEKESSHMLEAFAKADISVVGFDGKGDPCTPDIMQNNDLTIGVIGFTCKKDHAQGTICYVPFGDAGAIKDQVQRAKEQVDILVALVQWGSEKPEPDHAYRQFAHTLIDAGVDILHGESDHVYLGVETYNKGVIIYDSGDFVDIYMLNDSQKIARSFFYSVEWRDGALKKVILTPLLAQEGQLQLAKAHNKTEAIQLMQNISMNLGTHISDDGVITF